MKIKVLLIILQKPQCLQCTETLFYWFSEYQYLFLEQPKEISFTPKIFPFDFPH